MATMASTFLPSRPFSGSIEHQRRRSSLTTTFAARKEADHGQNDYSGKFVDENLIILRKRIYEIKMIERNYEAREEWTDWDQSFYTSYNSLICEVMGILQSMLMNTRPSLALGMIVLVTLSVPTSTVMAILYLMELSKGIFTGIHLG